MSIRGLRLKDLSLQCIALALTLAACSNDPIVYPNRNLRPPTAGDTSASGDAGEAGEMGADNGGATQGGSGGAKGGSGGKGGGGKGGSAGAPVVGPVCGNGIVEPPEECDDKNTLSGDGCSWDCKSACEICEQKVCPQFDVTQSAPQTASAYDDCYKLAGKIPTGPATGYPRAQVCQELVDCIRQEDCGQTLGALLKPQKCWCDKDWNDLTIVKSCQTDPDPANPTDPKRFIPGKCASLFQDASESARLIDVTAFLTGLERPEGAGLRLLTACDARECTEECVPKYFNQGGIATLAADIVTERNAAGESPLGNLVADSHRAIAAADFALVSTFFIDQGSDVPPDLKFAATPNRAADAPGRVLWSEALLVNYGHGDASKLGTSANAQTNNPLYKVTFTGQQIYDALTQQFNPVAGGMLFVSGLRYEWDAAQPIESRILKVSKDGSEAMLDLAGTYTVAVTNFLTGPSSPIPVLSQGKNASLVPNAEVSQILGEYLKQLPQPVAPPELTRIKRLN